MAPESLSSSAPGRTRRRPFGWGLGIALGVLVLAGGLYAWLAPGEWARLAQADLLWRRLGKPLLRTLGLVCLGLLAGHLIEALGWTRRLSRLASPLTKRAHLPAQAATAFAASFVSGITANAMLATAWREGRLDNRQLILANLLDAALPAFFLHLPTTLLVAYALLGWLALVYFGLVLLAALLRTLAVVLAGRMLLPDPPAEAGSTPPKAAPWREVWPGLAAKFLVRLRRLLLIILPVYLVVFLLAQGGFFTWLTQVLAGWVSSRVIPLEAMSVVMFAVVAEFTSGLAASAALLHSGGLSWQAVVIALLLGNVVATPVRALRHQLPHYMGIYEPWQGGKLLLIGQSARVASILLVTALFILVT